MSGERKQSLTEFDVRIRKEIREVNRVDKNALAMVHNNFVQARHSLTLEEIRLMDTIISFIQPDDEDFKVYKIPVSVLRDLYPNNRKDIYEVVKRAIEGLLRKPIRIESINSKGKREFFMANFIADGYYKEGDGFFEVSISARLKPYLLQLKEFFTKIPLKYTYVLKSRYSIRLYELLKQYEGTGIRIDSVPDLREMLGVDQNEYTDWRNFERVVIKKAVEEINAKTDLDVSYRKRKIGRKITHIEFSIRTKIFIASEGGEVGDEWGGRDINAWYPPKLTKSASESLDNQGFYRVPEKESEKVTKSAYKDTWMKIGDYRKRHNEFLSEIVPNLKRLNENQVLFLLLNTDSSLIPMRLLREIILNADRNPALTNPMGFLIKQLAIDMENAKFKELTLTTNKIDEELLKERLRELFVTGQSARRYFKVYWEKEIRGKVSRENAIFLKEPFLKAVYDDFENKIFIPLPDKIYSDWFKSNWLDSVRDFMKERFNIDDVELVILERD